MDEGYTQSKANHMIRTTLGNFAIGIDIGGTKIAGGVVDASGQVLIRRSFPTQAGRGGQPVLDESLALTQSLFNEAANQVQQIAGIGISLCELVDGLGNITSDYTIKWLEEWLAQRAG